ncbi:MAG: response regulator [Waterburya sp.]
MSLLKTKQSIDILICEDNLGDVYIINNVLENSTSNYDLHHVTNGEAAMNYLQKTEDYRDVSRPDLILLDLNLPKKHGFEVLQEIKTHPDLKTIPVIVLTSSKSDQDILKSYELFGSCFVTKPFDFEEFSNAMQDIEKFWLNLVQLPPKLTTKS